MKRKKMNCYDYQLLGYWNGKKKIISNNRSFHFLFTT